MPGATALLSLLYANDTTYFIAEKCINELYRKMNLYLSRAELWFVCNKLILHPGKTTYILFSQVNSPGNLLLMGQNIKQVLDAGDETSFKLVGVMIDEHLTWKYHVNKVKSKIAQAIALLCRSKKYLPRNIKFMLFKSLIMCHIDYLAATAAKKKTTTLVFSSWKTLPSFPSAARWRPPTGWR
jgi:hypothetical protein